MSRLVEIKTTLNAARLKNTFSENCGENSISTEDITKGWNKLKEKLPEDFFDTLKQSEPYVKGSKDNARQ